MSRKTAKLPNIHKKASAPPAVQVENHVPGKVGVISLGCPKNRVDTEGVLGRFVSAGWQVTAQAEEADLLLVNTCGFIGPAKAESVEAILHMAEIKTRAAERGKVQRLVVTGCLAQGHGDELAVEIPEIDLLVGSSQYHELIPIIEAREPARQVNRVTAPIFRADDPERRILTTPPYTAYLKIAEGCDNPCAFCIIPQLRGPYRSRPAATLLEEARLLAAGGVVELNVISQDTTLYGRDLSPRSSLAALLRELVGVPGIRWIRLLYLYPALITDELIDLMAREEKILPYFDLPLQHSHSGVLTRMRRPEREKRILGLIERIRARMPDATLRAAFITGFPGESAAEFDHLLRFVEDTRFDHVGVFTYSDEEAASAFHLADKIPEALAEERRQRLMAVQREISAEKLATQVGRTVPLLMEGVSTESDLLLQGRTMAQAPDIDGVVHITEGFAPTGSITQAEIIEAHEYDLVGRIVDDES